MGYLFISLIILILSFLLFKKASGTMSIEKINMISYIFYFNLLLQSFIGSILILYNITEPYWINFLDITDKMKYYGWLAVLYTMIMMPIGMILASKLLLIKSVKGLFKSYTHRPLTTWVCKKDSYVRYIFYFLSFLTFFFTFYTFINLKEIPILAVFKGYDPEVLARLRIMATREFLGIHYIKEVACIFIPILTYIAYGYWKISKSRKDLLWFLLMFANSFFILTYNIAKAPFLKFLLGFLFLQVILKGKIKLKNILIYSIIITMLLVIMYSSILGLADFKSFFSLEQGIVGRLIISQIEGLYVHLIVFPDIHNFLGLTSVYGALLSDVFDLERSEFSSRIIVELLWGEFFEEGKAGVMNTLFVGEAWANFGLLGVLLSPLYVGFVLGFIYYLLIKSKKIPLFIGVLAFISVNSMVTGGLNAFLYNPYYLIVFALLFGTVLLTRFLNEETLK